MYYNLDRIDTIIFDFDGTLFKGDTLSLPIYQECLSILIKEFHYNMKFPSDETILSFFGKQQDEIYEELLHNANPDIINAFAECIESTEVTAFREGKGDLYEGVQETLQELKNRNYKLAICTNAREDYFDAAVERFQLDKYFTIMYAAGMFKDKDKVWMVQKIIEKLKSSSFAVIGDRHHDIEAAKVNDGIAIGCTYGFGSEEVKKADIRIKNFKELLLIFK
jgi:HAD superfamily hydrolase (TIGR01549 family)